MFSQLFLFFVFLIWEWHNETSHTHTHTTHYNIYYIVLHVFSLQHWLIMLLQTMQLHTGFLSSILLFILLLLLHFFHSIQFEFKQWTANVMHINSIPSESNETKKNEEKNNNNNGRTTTIIVITIQKTRAKHWNKLNRSWNGKCWF